MTWIYMGDVSTIKTKHVYVPEALSTKVMFILNEKFMAIKTASAGYRSWHNAIAQASQNVNGFDNEFAMSQQVHMTLKMTNIAALYLEFASPYTYHGSSSLVYLCILVNTLNPKQYGLYFADTILNTFC